MINFNQFFVYHLVKKVFAKLRETFSKIKKNSKVQKKPVENLNINTIKFKNKTINILSTLFGLLIIAAIFYIRLLSRQARDLWQNASNYRLIITLIIVLIITLSVYAQINALVLQNKQLKLFSYFTNKMQVFIDFLKMCLKQAYYFIILFVSKFCDYFGISFSYFNLLRPIIKSFCNQATYKKYFIVLLFLRIIPLIIFSFVFCFEVIYYRYLNLTFKLIPILLIPLIEKVFIFIISDFSELFDNFFMLSQSSLFKHKESIYYEGLYYNFSEHYNKKSKKFRNFNDYFYNYFLVLKNIKKATDKYKIEAEHLYIKIFFLLLTLLRLAILYYMYWLMITYKIKQGFPIY